MLLKAELIIRTDTSTFLGMTLMDQREHEAKYCMVTVRVEDTGNTTDIRQLEWQRIMEEGNDVKIRQEIHKTWKFQENLRGYAEKNRDQYHRPKSDRQQQVEEWINEQLDPLHPNRRLEDQERHIMHRHWHGRSDLDAYRIDQKKWVGVRAQQAYWEQADTGQPPKWKPDEVPGRPQHPTMQNRLGQKATAATAETTMRYSGRDKGGTSGSNRDAGGNNRHDSGNRQRLATVVHATGGRADRERDRDGKTRHHTPEHVWDCGRGDTRRGRSGGDWRIWAWRHCETYTAGRRREANGRRGK